MDGDVIKVPAPGVSKVIDRLLASTIGQKAIMAVTGFALVGFVFVHMAGHLQMFQGPEAYNKYAHMLQGMGGIKWGLRGLLLVGVFAHMWAGVRLMMRNMSARPDNYAVNKWLAASASAKTMRVTGPIVLFFIVYHLLHFTLLKVSSQGFEDMVYQLNGVGDVPDVYQRMVVSYQNPVLTAIYVLSVTLLGTHLAHGIQSMFQTLGLNNNTYRPAVQVASRALALIAVLGFVAVPLAILAGVIK
jgi:succinate dehydrogenase / fumarate reductase cytochrome b subunit